MTLLANDMRSPRRLRGRALPVVLAVVSFAATGCGSSGSTGEGSGMSVRPPAASAGGDGDGFIAVTGTAQPQSSASTPSGDVDATIASSTPPATMPTSSATPVVATSSTVAVNTMPPGPTTTSGALPATPYVVPMANPGAAGWGDGHSAYPATDIFAACGAEIVSPVDGVATEVRTVDSWDADVDNPATRGGRSVTIVGDDGVRYYLAHFDEIDSSVGDGDRILAGERLGTVGLTGRTSGCHLHFAISPPCPGKEWSVRRGVIPPKSYLDAWRDGLQPSPLAEVLQWSNDNPGACEAAMSDPFAQDS